MPDALPPRASSDESTDEACGLRSDDHSDARCAVDAAPAAAAAPARPNCPCCGGALRRVRRHARDRRERSAGQHKRYRCLTPACRWGGLLESPAATAPSTDTAGAGGADAETALAPPAAPARVRRRRRQGLGARRRLRRWWLRWRRTALPLLGFASLCGAVAAVVWQAGLWQPKAGRFYARGEHAEGEPLPRAHGLSIHHVQAALQARADAAEAARPEPVPDTLALRYGCVWGQPGRNPYKGSVEQALRSAALPEEVVQQVARQVRANQPIDTLEIRNEGIKALGSGRTFNPQNVALTFGRSLCIGSRVNFPEGHVETAALYEATTAQGRIVAVMVPQVCGNVSVLGQTLDATPSALKAQTATDEPLALRWMPGVLDAPATSGTVTRQGLSTDVPEPGTLPAVLGGLGLWILMIRRRR